LLEAIKQSCASVRSASLTEQIDTTTSAGRLQFHIFGALAQFEREAIRERTRAGLAAARARGRLGGRPPLVTPEKLAAAQLMRERKHTMNEIVQALGVSRATLYRHLALADSPRYAPGPVSSPRPSLPRRPPLPTLVSVPPWSGGSRCAAAGERRSGERLDRFSVPTIP
jgi:hypothetical protein